MRLCSLQNLIGIGRPFNTPLVPKRNRQPGYRAHIWAILLEPRRLALSVAETQGIDSN